MTNISVDVMHDVWEGVVQYDIAKILNVFINTNKYFSLEQLNQRILAFPYQEWGNKLVEIQKNHLKKKLKMSSAENMTLARNFTLLIGDLVPQDNSCWDLFLKLKKALDLIMDNVPRINSHKYLKVLISEYLNCLNEVFPASIKPKHHHLIHYPRVLSQMGPLWHLSSMWFESRHREGKKVSRAAICRANICHTIAIKTQLQLNHRFVSKDPLPSIFTLGPVENSRLIDLPYFLELQNTISISDESAVILKWITRYSKKILPGDILVEHNEESSDPTFFIIESFISDSTYGLIIITKTLQKSIFF